MKKNIFLLMMLIGISLLGFQSLAYKTTTTSTTNKITTSFIDLVLSVKTLNEENEWVDLNTQTIKVMPGDVRSQIPYVTNTGEVPMYTRVYLDSKIMDEDGKAIDSMGLVFDIDTEKWKLDEEGWYRFTEIVDVGESTTPLFTEVYIPTDLGNNFSKYTTSIKLYAQAVQSEYNDYQQSVYEVEGWPIIIVNEMVNEGEDE